MTYDGIRFYAAYINLLKVNSGFFSIPEQWYYIVPRAGLSYAGTLMILGGPMAARWSMFLAWLALMGIACRGQVKALGSSLALGSGDILLSNIHLVHGFTDARYLCLSRRRCARPYLH